MKSFIKVIAVVAILILLTGVYAAVKDKKGTDNNGNTTNEAGTLTNYKNEDILSFKIINENGQFEFSKSGEKWFLLNQNNVLLDQTVSAQIFEQLLKINTTEVISQNAKDTSQYGFDNSLSVEINLINGKKVELEFGKQNSTKQSNYARFAGKNKIFLVGSFVYDIFNFKLTDIKDTTLFAMDSTKITGFTLLKKNKKIYSIEKDEDSNWVIEYPTKSYADKTTLSNIFDSFAALYKIQFIENDAKNLKKYGLDNPAYTINVSLGSDQKVLMLGDMKVSGDEIYAKLGNSNDIFTMDIAALNFIDKPLYEIMESFVYSVPIANVSKVMVYMDKTATILEIESDGINSNKDTFIVNGTDVSKISKNGRQTARLYYQALIALERNAVFDSSKKPSGFSDATITYTLDNGNKVKLDFVSKNADNYYVLFNDKYYGVTMKKSQFDADEGLREAYKNLMKLLK